MHVVITVNAAWNIWNFRRPLVEALLADGHRVTILAPPDETVGKLQSLGAQFAALPMDPHSWSPMAQLRLYREFRSQFARLRPDAVLSYTIKNNIFGAYAARAGGIQFLPNITGLGTLFLGSKIAYLVGCLFYRTAFASVPIVFVQNGDDRDFLLRNRLVAPGKLRMLPGSGIDLDHFRPVPLSPGPTVNFLLVGRMLRDKGVMEFCRAARILKARGIDARFRLLGAFAESHGKGLAREEIEPFLAAGEIEHLGTVEDIRGPMADAHCIVLPSYREGAPRALLEASAMGRPVVATDVPGCRDVVEDGRTGYLCAARDAEDLADAIERMVLAGFEKMDEMGRAGRSLTQRKFSANVVTGSYREALAQIGGAA